ncbi:hypothetical protein Tco_0703835 [Tanacetum coccineum]|uniref:Uncharacterized protein n=1 Tax=Tanacetum coccineum TaxID=301880 RepID=A0ABQ4Y029_9ASTR
MCMYLKNQGGYKQSHFKGMSYEDIRPIFKRNEKIESKLVEEEIVQQEDVVAEQVVIESSKNQRMISIDIESAATKKLIVVLEEHSLTENMMYYQIIRADGSSKNYKIFSEMLDDFDRQDGDLKILFEPNEEDEIWKNQQDYNLISWRLFDSCGIHMLLMHTRIAIHMMIEKKYPLTQEMLSRMLSRRLEVDQESEMAFELLMFVLSQLQK